MDLPTFDIQTPGENVYEWYTLSVILFILLCFVPNVIIFCFDNGMLINDYDLKQRE